MKKKLIGIIIFMMLICITIPVIESSSIEDNNETQGSKYFAIIFVRGKVEDVKEENHNGAIWYNCTIVNVKMFRVICIRPPLKFLFYRDHLVDFGLPLWLPKDSFYGIIKDGFIFGTAFLHGDWNLLRP